MRFSVALLLLAIPSFAQKQPVLAKLGWLEGKWSGLWEGRLCEEWFSAPTAGTIAVSFRMTAKDKTVLLQFGSISEQDGSIVLLMRSFGPQMQPYGEMLLLKLGNADAKTLEFTNPTHTKPKRTLYIREAADTLRVRSEILHDNGKEEVHGFTMQRAARP